MWEGGAHGREFWDFWYQKQLFLIMHFRVKFSIFLPPPPPPPPGNFKIHGNPQIRGEISCLIICKVLGFFCNSGAHLFQALLIDMSMPCVLDIIIHTNIFHCVYRLTALTRTYVNNLSGCSNRHFTGDERITEAPTSYRDWHCDQPWQDIVHPALWEKKLQEIAN